jgi:hypothetical protein
MDPQTQEKPPSRERFVIRLLYTLLFPPIYGICNFLVLLTTLFQFALLLITRRHSEPVRAFANRLISYEYRIWRYISLNSSQRPFPFAEFPPEVEPPEAKISFT